MATYDSSTPAPPYGYPSAGDQGVDAHELIKVVRRRRMLIVGTILGITTLATVAAFGLTPRYAGVASVMIDPQATRVVNTEGVIEEQAQDRSAIESQITMLRSRNFARRLLERSELLAGLRPDRQPRQASPLEALVADHWPAVSDWLSRSWLVETGLAKSSMAPPEATGDSPQPEREEAAIDDFLGKLNVSRNGESYAISIGYTSTDPVTAAQVANEVARRYIEDQLVEKRAAASRAAEWLSRRLAELRGQLLESENAIASYRAENELIDSRGVNLESAQLTALHSELISARAERAQKETKLALLRQIRQRGRGYESVNEIVTSPVISSLRAQQNDLLRDEAQMLQEYGPRHPTIIQLNAEKQRLQDKIYSEVQNIINGFESEVGFLRNRERELEASLEQAKARVAESQQAEVQLRELEREAEANRALYTALLERFKKLNEQQDGLQAGAQIISTAAVPTSPAFPQQKLIIMIGFTGSLVAAGLLTLIAEILESGLRSAAQVERALRLSCLAHVPQVKLKDKVRAHHYPTRKPRSAYAEAVRSVQVGLQFTNAAQPPQVVLVTSSLPSEGKTTLALSLAASAAAAGQKSLILDLDLRHPSVRPASDQGLTAPGLVELVSGDVQLEDVIYTDPTQPNLDMITVKRNPVNPIDLLASKRMPLLMTQLRSRYKFIVLDAPPILGITDTKIAMHLADGVLFVVRWGKTKADVAANGVAALRDCRAPLLGVVMTQVNMRRHAQAAYGDAVEYYDQYKHYYTD